MLNNLLLITCICIVTVLTLYFFYWNRFIALLIGQAFRIFYWNQEGGSIWLEIGSIHFSLLAGRILLKDVRYHSSNQTVKIVKAQIQWRYWIRRPTHAEELNSLHGEDAKLSGRMWACRIQFSFQGVEWFLYNRTAAYDNILTQMEKATQSLSRSSSHFRFFRRFYRHSGSSEQYASRPHILFRMPSFVVRCLTWLRNQKPSFDGKDLLPLGIDIQRGVIIMGNRSTPNLLVAEFQNAFGTYGIVPSKSEHDLYKQVLNLHFQSPLFRLVGNDSFIDPMPVLGGLVDNRAKSDAASRQLPFYHSYRPFTRLWRQINLYRLTTDYFATRSAQRMAHKSLTSQLPGFKKSRAAEDETPIGIDFSTYEYAIEPKILEASALELTYYVDVVGEVPSVASSHRTRGGMHDVGNGGADPEWGFDLVVFGGILRYGPWADRQRAELQRVFFPSTYQDHEVTSRLKPGDKRVWTALKVFVEFRDETSLHIPFREASKDWQWDGIVGVPHRPRKREPAFFSLTVGDRSSMSYVLPMVIGRSGYEAALEVHLDTISITSSLNDIRLVTAESTRVHGEMPAPVRWNNERIWTFAVYLRHPTLYLLRDHINMFTDLGKDWTSGPPTDYQKFIPMIYAFQFEMSNYQWNLYVNDHNIIDKPLIREENALLTFRGPHLRTNTTIHSNVFRPESTSFPFTISAPDLLADFSLPRWSTHALNAQKHGISLFKTKLFNIDGSYRYFAEVREDNIDQLKLDIGMSDPVLRAFGWSIRYFMVLRENYFGSFTQFQTLSEYLEKRKDNFPTGDPLKFKYRPGKANMLQVELIVRAERSTILLPTSLVGSSAYTFDEEDTFNKAVSLSVPEIQLQLRLHDYYMEMSLNYDRITASIFQDSAGQITPTTPHEILVIDGMDVVANRLFGPQPRTAVYVCIWEIALGHVKASMSANQAKTLAAAGNSFRYNFVDLVNAPAENFAVVVDPDVTFYKVAVKSVEVTWKAGHAAMLLQLSKGIKLDRNDLGTQQYKKVTCLRVPQMSCKILLTSSLQQKVWLEAAEITADAYLDVYFTPRNHQTLTRAQLAFIEEQDRTSNRAKRIFHQLRPRQHSESQQDRISHRNGVYLPQPRLPRCMSSSVGEPSKDNSRSDYTRPASWRLPNLDNLSDTEGEERVSEADRDARLAKTRTSTPVPQTYDDDQAMSSGDESDDADLTDGHSSEDDWSEIGNPQEQGAASLLSFYSPIVRHYAANCALTPGFWDSAAFHLSRENLAFITHEIPPDKPQNTPAFVVRTFPEGISEEEDVTTTRWKCQKMNLTYTPLTLPAFDRLEDDLRMVVPNAEMCIDLFLGGCISKVSTKDALECSILHFDVSHVAFQALQHLAMLKEGRPNVLQAKECFRLPTNFDIVSVFNLHAAGVHFSGIFHRYSSALSISIDELAGSLDTSIDKRTLSSPQPQSTILNFSCSSPSIHLSRRSLQADLGAISLVIGHRGPELVTATGLALASSVTYLSTLVYNQQALRLLEQRSIIVEVLNCSQRRPFIDSLSTIQPSYLVQSGTPQLLRTDVSFKFLYHLCNCLSTMDPLCQVRKQLPLGNDLDVLTSSIEARLIHLDPDASSIDYLTSLHSSLLKDPAVKKQVNDRSRSLAILAVRFGSARIAVPAPVDGSSSELLVTDITIDALIKKQDLIQFNLTNPSSASQTSLRAKTPKGVRKTAIIASIDDLSLILAPHLMDFAQNVLRVNGQIAGRLDGALTRKRTPVDALEGPSKTTHTEVIWDIRQLRVQAAAENLVLVLGLLGVRVATTLLGMQGKALSANLSVLFDQIYLQARSPSHPAQENDHDILAALSFENGRSNIVSRSDSRSNNIKGTFALAGLKVHVPRSALRLYRFVEEWREDYLPGFETTLKTLLSEYQTSPAKPSRSPTPSYQSRPNAIIQIHSQIEHVEVSLQVMHGTWLSLELHQTVAYAYNSAAVVLRANYDFGVQVNSMVLSISSKPLARDVTPSPRVKIALPRLSVAGKSDGSEINMLTLLEFMDLKVKASHWDTLLAVQQKFGQDFNDLLILMQRTRQKPLSDKKPIRRRKVMEYAARVKIQGFRIGFVGLYSTVFLECQDINGSLTSSGGWTWDVGLSDLALSLSPRISDRQNTGFNRKQRSAFVIIDVNIYGSKHIGGDTSVHLSMTKIHAVMQPSSIGEFGDFIDNLQAEMLERQEQRALELAAFKKKAQSILETFDVNVADMQLEKASWLDDLIVGISIQNIGVAFPLTHDEELQISRNRAKESIAVRAFLFCIKTIDFTASRGETGQATIERLSFQFVPKFKQSSPDDFAADKHQSRNCLIYPEMQAQLRISTSGASRKLWIKATVSGFILDVDSTIPNYVFSLIDVYRQGKERVERLSSITPRTPTSAISISASVQPPLERHYTAVPTSNVFAELTFLSGKVRFFSASASDEFKSRTPFSQKWDISDDQVLDLGAEVFNLPVVSVWTEYRATPASQKLTKGSELEPSLLVFKSTVFSSQNTLRPTLLPFLTELVSQIETRLRKISCRTALPPFGAESTPTPFDRHQEMDFVSSMQISFSLRIDKSTLELTCQPDVNVVAGLNWESGGFIVNVSPGARKVFFSGSVGGLTIGLKHGFLSEDCVKLDARNLTFSVSFTKTALNDGESVSSVSVVVDTEFLGGVRFSRLQDILCFKAVWLDRIPILDSQAGVESRFTTKSISAETAHSTRGFSTAVLLRIRHIALDVDLGQSVSKLNLNLNQIIFRTSLTDNFNEVFLYIADVSISANGNISGHARVPSCIFQTMRRSEGALREEDQGKSCMLELRLTSGALVADFESDLQKLLHYRAEPLKVEVFDDWSQTQVAVNDESRPVHLTFTISCSEIVAVITVGTIPKLLSYMNKFKANLDVQRQGAFRESQTFRITWTPKPDNPLSAVGEAMLHSARNRFKETGVSLIVRQYMNVRLDLLRLIVFPRTMRDLEIAQLVGKDIRAHLDGLVGSDSPPGKRDLHLSFASMVVSKYNRVRPVYKRLEKSGDEDGREWLAALFQDASEANIFGLPSMKMHMISEESIGDFARILIYDFFSTFVRREGMKAFEDIYITLNMSLYAWLTVLRKNLSREMDQVRASEDWRASMSASSTAISPGPQRKRKVPEPLSLGDPLSGSSRQSGALSPSGPPSTHLASVEEIHTPASVRENLISPVSLLSGSSSPVHFPVAQASAEDSPISQPSAKRKALVYKSRNRQIERLTMRQLGEATPDVMHPFFMKKAGFSLEDSLPQYVHEYATAPLEEILDVLLKLYSRQLLSGNNQNSERLSIHK